VQLPGGERVPFLFTVKDLVAKGNGNAFKPGFQMGGEFSTPSYRTGLFLDPKGRGGTTGYDMAVALPGLQSGEEGDDELFNENNKVFDVTTGRIEMEVNKVNTDEQEIGGVFVATQLSDTDMGSKIPKKILTKGIFYARVE
jgi:photosystem II oxygen-evolving enhancer protein 1